MDSISINVVNVSKVYNLYDSPASRLKEAFDFRKNMSYHKEYYALNNVSFQVKKGETFGIIGTNGAGKSTLLKLITGVASPSKGSIEVNGKISALLELGAGFNPEYTGLENIYLNGAMIGYNKSEMKQRVEQIAQFADIGEYLYQPVKTYSSGMFARLAFAVAINIEQDILIVDEALSVGDMFFQNKCYKKFDELRSKGVTVLFVSHDIATVKQMCSRVLWLEKGVPQMVGDSVEVCNAYSNSVLEKRAKEFESTRAAKKNIANMMQDVCSSVGYHVEPIEHLGTYPAVQYTNESILDAQVEILSAYVTDTNGKIVSECNVNEECCVHLIFKSNRDIDQCIAGFVLETVKGLWVINTNSLINGEHTIFQVKENSIYHVEFHFVMPAIMNGDYVIGVAISEGTMKQYKVLTWLYHTLYFRVNNTAQNSAVIDVPTEIKIFNHLLEE